MNIFALDTFAAISRLKDAGFTEPQAKEIVQVFKEADTSELVTKGDIRDVRNEIKDVRQELKALRNEVLTFKTEILGEVKLNRWMLGVIIAAVMSLVLHTFLK